MKITIELDTEQDGECAAGRMINADDAWLALDGIRNDVRGIWKYEDLEGVNPGDIVDRIYEIICDACANVHLDERWQ